MGNDLCEPITTIFEVSDNLRQLGVSANDYCLAKQIIKFGIRIENRNFKPGLMQQISKSLVDQA